MLANLWFWIKGLFTAKKIGILTTLIIANGTKSVAAEILDDENQRKAFEFVKELQANTELTNT